MSEYAEAPFEASALQYFAEIGYETAHGPEIGPDGSAPERTSYGEVLLLQRLRGAIRQLNPGLAPATVETAIAAVQRFESANVSKEAARRYFLIRDGVPVEVEMGAGQRRTIRVRLMDLSPSGHVNNDFLAVNQLRVVEPTGKRRADLVVYLNGIPVAVFELKSPGAPNATIRGAFNQLQTYIAEIPSLMAWAQILVIADGALARVGTVTANVERFAKWRTIETEDPVTDQSEIKVLIHGLFARERLCEVLDRYVDWADMGDGITARLAQYNQYWGVRAAHAAVKRASGPAGDRRAGIVFHGQGSGKSMELLLLANVLVRDPDMGNPTFVAVSDRSDLDDQLFEKEFKPSLILPEPAVNAETGMHLAQLLARPAGGIVVTTLQKFDRVQENADAPVALTQRSNVIVGSDEAHRSQFGLVRGLARDIRDAIPNATFVGFTGTPIELADRSTTAVFGQYISRYTPQQAVEDGATVPIYYESRVAHIALTSEAEAYLELALGQLPASADEEELGRAYGEWSRVRTILEAEPVIDRVVRDVIGHWEARRATIAGKAMLVCVSREAAARAYERIAALRPDWVAQDDAHGRVKAVYTGSAADPADLRAHVRTPDALRELKSRAQRDEPNDPLDLIIVVDLWLTGFDAPSLTTIYLAKPMRGHALFQAVTRPNRVWRDKPAGLVVSYVPVADALNAAVATFTRGGVEPAVGVPIEDAIRALRAKHEVVSGILAGHLRVSIPAEPSVRYERAEAAAHFLLADEVLLKRYLDQSLALAKVYAIAGGTDVGAALLADVDFFLAVRGIITKLSSEEELTKPSGADIRSVIRTVAEGAIEADEIIDVYARAGEGAPGDQPAFRRVLGFIATQTHSQPASGTPAQDPGR